MRKYLSLYTFIGIVGLSAVFIGFSKTFIIPVSNSSFHAPWIIYVHGFFALSWIALFFCQAYLIKAENWSLHMTLGILGLLIAVGVAVTIPFAGAYQAQKDITSFGEGGVSAVLGTFTTAIMFLSLVLAGLHFRQRPEVHKRLLLLATIVVLWPAFFRFRHFFPNVPNPEIWFALILADSLIIIAWIWDKLATGKIHPVLLYVGAFIILEQSFEAITYDTDTWRSISKQVYDIFR